MPPSNKEILRRTIDALEASMRRYPDNDKILLQLALAYSQVGRFDPAAVAVYTRAVQFHPTDVKVQKALSVAHMVNQTGAIAQSIDRIEDLDEASIQESIEKLLRLTREFPDSPYVHKALGDLQLLRGEERDATQHYRCALALGMTDIQGVCDNYEAVRRLRRISSKMAIFFADLYQRLGKDEIANKIFQELFARKNTDPYVLEKFTEFLAGRVEEHSRGDQEIAARYARQLIWVWLARGNAGEAIQRARQLAPAAIIAEPPLAKELSRRLLALEDFRQAFEYLSRIPLDDETKSILNEMAGMLEKRGEFDTAVYILQFINNNDELARETRQKLAASSAPRGPEDLHIEIETELQMAELHWKNRRWDQAFERYMRVLELGYEDYRSLLEPLDLIIQRITDITPDQLAFLSNFFFERRDWRRALNFALRGLELVDNHEDPNLSQRVLKSCERILLEDPEDCDVRLVHGDELLRIGNIERALQEYRKCAENPEFKMKANRRLALASFRAGDLQGAFERYRNLPILEAEDLERLYDLAMAFSVQEQFKDAFEAIKLVREYDPQFRDSEARSVEFEEKMNSSNVGFVIDPKMRELIGDHSIGRYKYIGKIGSGGMGVVHKVLDLKTNQVVAMKILREGLSSSGKAIDRFFREARIAATLRHRNIVNILDYNISNNYGQSYIAMEFVDGPSLREIIEKKFSMTVDIGVDDIVEVLDWCSQLCDALDATHKKGIIHRDIKPDNIMLAPGSLIKITDFGIVHIEEATFTPTGALIGTPRYMSPEQVHGGRIDGRSDIYAVGIILYELLIGSPPFISGDISYQQVNVMPTPPREICPTISQSVDRIIMRCLEKTPGDRYQSALDLKKDIDEAYIRLGGDPKRRMPSAAGSRPADPAATAAPVAPMPLRTPVPVRSPIPNPTVANEDSIETPTGFLQRPHGPAETKDASLDLDSELDV
ncbi:protein kinase [bacterium]|nr:protein kinase [bacterium]